MKTKSVVAVIAILLCICTSVHATVLRIQDLTLSMAGLTTFYTYSSGSGSMRLSNVSVGPPALILEGMTGNGGYTISSAKVTISSSLLEDTSSGNLASGNFQGGQTLTVTGTLKYNNVAITPANTSLIVATMASQTWSFGELAGSPITLDGSIYFTPDVTQGLGHGIVNGSDTLKIDAFRADFSFKSVNPNPSVLNTNQSLAGTANLIQIVAAPEPATVFLFTMAALAFRINKKK